MAGDCTPACLLHLFGLPWESLTLSEQAGLVVLQFTAM